MTNEYTIPLKKLFDKPKRGRAKKAVRAIKEFVKKHKRLNEDQIVVSKEVNEKIWERGMFGIPRKIEVSSNKKLLAEKSTKIIAVSENTKKDIIKFYGIPDDKISVIHHGCSFNKKSDESKLKLNNLPKKYLLFVGKRSLYKNFKGFIVN